MLMYFMSKLSFQFILTLHSIFFSSIFGRYLLLEGLLLKVVSFWNTSQKKELDLISGDSNW